MNKTKIEWCDSTWNPVTGCQNDCEYCYARRMTCRFGGASKLKNSEDGDECKWITKANGKIHRLDKQIYDFDRKRKSVYPFEFDPTFHAYCLDNPQKWKESRTIFVCSMADLFGDWIPDEWIDEVFKACGKAPQHRYLFLTKNPQRLCELAKNKKRPKGENDWWGSTITTKQSQRYPGRGLDNTFLSIEPLLEPLDAGLGSFGNVRWIIVGAETGNRKDKVIPKKKWIDNVCEAAAITHIPIFMKDSLIPIVGEENMRREFPWNQTR